MGTSGSYTGGGGAAGRDLREQISQWLESLPTSGDELPQAQHGGVVSSPDRPPDVPRLPSEALVSAIRLFAVGDGGGPGVGRGGRRGRRSVLASARTAGRAVAAAYALRTRDVAILTELGLDYAGLRGLDSFEQVRRIVDAACGSTNDGTIEDDERRLVAAQVAEWVLEQEGNGAELDLEEILRETIATIIFEAAATETGHLIRNGTHPSWASLEGERQMRELARALADRAQLTPGAATPDDVTRAIAEGLETLRYIRGAA